MRKPRITIRRLMIATAVAAVILSLIVYIPRAIRLRQNHQRLAVARHKAISGLFQADLLRYETGTVTLPQPYETSIQELASEIDLDSSKGNRIVALKGHLQRMTSLRESAVRASSQFESDPIWAQHSQYYHAEAESWLAKAEAEW